MMGAPTPGEGRRDGDPAPDVLDAGRSTTQRSLRDTATPESARERRKALEDRRRTQVTDIAHDLKTPLSIVAALLDRIRSSEGLSTAVRADAEAARRQLGTMAALLAELLDPERALVRGIELDEQPCDVAALVHEVVEGFEPIAAVRRIRLDYDGPPRLITTADGPRLERVVANLVANALRFAPFDGRVHVAIAERVGTIHLEVADNGPGIRTSERERVFDRNYRGARSPHDAGSQRSATGIGLATAKEIVELHRGTVRADRAPEGGALFIVELPIVAPGDEAAAAYPSH